MTNLTKAEYLQLKADVYRSAKEHTMKLLCSGEWVPLMYVWRAINVGDRIGIYNTKTDEVYVIDIQENLIMTCKDSTIAFDSVRFYTGTPYEKLTILCRSSLVKKLDKNTDLQIQQSVNHF